MYGGDSKSVYGLAFSNRYASLVALDPRRSTWFICLTLAVFVIVSGQVRAIDACACDLNAAGDDVALSIMDDGFVALPALGIPQPIHAPERALLFPSVPPSGRVVVCDLFRPPMFPVS